MADCIPPSVLRVINASCKLTASESLLAGEYYRLDRGHQGCYAREEILARRVALGIRAMKACRTRLKELGIISSVPVEGDRRRQTVYFTFAERYHPSEFAKDDEVFRLAEMLDDDIRSGRLHERVVADRVVTEVLDKGMGERGRTESAGDIAKRLVQSGSPIAEQSVQPGAPNPGESVQSDAPLGAANDPDRCSLMQKSVQSDAKIGAVSRTPIESVLNKNVVRTLSTEGVSQNASVQSGAPIRTDGSQSDLHKKNGTTGADPNTKPQTQPPECPHPHGSPEWKHWHLTRLRASVVAS